MESEPASEKQRHYLRSLLHTRGVRDGDCQPLIEAVYPNGLTKREASEEIEKLKYLNGLPARWIHACVRQLRQCQGYRSMQSSRTWRWRATGRPSQRGSVGCNSKS